ncbi:hypothetical protein [Nocardia alba]|uniref:DUF4190 domain-containing protein n=1 Tax=Nocardia alba TaxID=225051 RepID=A0A4R1G1A3_9NOCA|nr:hypothetical protein [Nocardia alba]TCJ99964.1 hypothetical protein DFR71_0951 [Nocardia alba]
MGTEPEWRVELGKDQGVPRVQDAPEVSDSAGIEPWGGIANPGPAGDLPPYPPPPPPGPMFPAPGYPAVGNAAPIYPTSGYPPAGRAPYGAPHYPGQFPAPPPPGYGYRDTTPVWSIVSFCCVAASVLGGAMLCGLPVLVTAPTGVVLGLVGHAKGEPLGKWAAIANGAIAALAVVLVLVFMALIGGM